MTARRRLTHRKHGRVRQGAAPVPPTAHKSAQPEEQPTRGDAVPAKNDPKRPVIHMRPHIRKAFQTNPGEVLWMSDLRNAIRDGNPKAGDGTRLLVGSIQNAVRGLVLDGFPIEVVEHGQAWRYTPKGTPNGAAPTEAAAEKPVPAPPAPKTLFELLAVRRDGSYLLEDENGQLFSASPLQA